MTTVNIYLNFEGNCEEAFNFYKSAFGGEFSHVSRFGEMPKQEGMPEMKQEIKNKLMHIALPISNETMLMGSDSVGFGPRFVQGNNFSISINPTDKSEADRLFAALSKGGIVTMPLNNTFWGDYFGLFIDKFGINWMVNCRISQ